MLDECLKFCIMQRCWLSVLKQDMTRTRSQNSKQYANLMHFSTLKAYNDLKVWHDLKNYFKHDSQVTNAALKAMERHFWYLTEKCAMFSTFSERQIIAQTLLRIP